MVPPKYMGVALTKLNERLLELSATGALDRERLVSETVQRVSMQRSLPDDMRESYFSCIESIVNGTFWSIYSKGNVNIRNEESMIVHQIERQETANSFSKAKCN